jgi:phosphatidyl-myo-inositol dimannoside synthase
MPWVLRSIPEALLLLVGDGPTRRRMERLARDTGVVDSVVFAGAVPWSEAPGWFDVGDVFAMPCRTRKGGLEPEALGIVFLEAQACGHPVLVGDSGGAPETVLHGETGYVVDPFNPVGIGVRAAELLADLDGARLMGEKGRAWVEREWTWETSVSTLSGLLAGSSPSRRA